MKASRHAAAACGVLVALGATCAIDLGVKTGPSESTAAGIPSSLENASPYHPDWSRVLKEDSVLTLPGLWSRALVDVELAASSALPKGQVITGLGNGIPLRTQDVGGREGILRFDGASDSRGRLRLTVKGQSQGAALRISSWRVVQERQPRVPARCLLPSPRWLPWRCLLSWF